MSLSCQRLPPAGFALCKRLQGQLAPGATPLASRQKKMEQIAWKDRRQGQKRGIERSFFQGTAGTVDLSCEAALDKSISL